MREELTGVDLPGPGVAPSDADRVYDRDDLPPDGEGDEVVTQGMLMALMDLARSLKRRRESMGLTIGEVARRSRLTPVTISRLENLHNRNPSLDTLFRYAMALDALVTLGFEAIEPDDEAVPGQVD
jgi:DNA-binding XRE family transcriptional regulator